VSQSKHVVVFSCVHAEMSATLAFKGTNLCGASRLIGYAPFSGG